MRRDLLQRGYQLVRALQVDGIPYLFTERELLTVLGTTPGVPSGYTAAAVLSLDDGAEVSQDCDRKAGFAAASEVRYLLGRQPLKDTGLAEALFATPTDTSTLTTSVTSPSTTTFVVDSTSGWPASGSAYIGRERFTYTGTTGTSFTGVTRGVAGLTHYHTADTASAYAEVTDRPRYWRGRLVTVWVHVVSPEGRYLGADLCTLGDYCWQEWRGEVVEVPKPTRAGFELRVGSLVSKLAGEVGATIKGKVAFDTAGVPLIYFTPSDSLRIIELGGGLDTEGAPAESRIGTLTDWSSATAVVLNAGAGSDDVFLKPAGRGVRVRVDFGGTAGYTVRPSAWFLDPQERQGVGGFPLLNPVIPAIWNSRDDLRRVTGFWLVVELGQSADFTDATPDSSGLAVLRSGDAVELVRYDATATGFDGRFTAFRIVERRLQGTAGIDPWEPGTELALISAVDGPLFEVALRLWVSSGMTGARGTFDQLSFGFGMGVPQDWIDLDSFNRGGWFFDFIGGYITEATGVEDVIGGHLALRRQCLVQTTGSDGQHKVRVVSTEVTDDPDAATLTAAAVLLDGSSDPEQLEAPNHIVIDASSPGTSGAKHVIRDASRAQAEGKLAWTLDAPGMDEIRAIERGATLILLSDGQQAMKVRLPPWSELQIGDSILDLREHPAIYDYTLGQWAPPSIAGRVVGMSTSQWDETREATVLLAGQYGNTVYLAPSAEVTTAVSSTVLRVAKGTAGRFLAGEDVAVYLPGSEATDYEEHEVDSIDTSNPSYDVITLATALSVVTPAAGLVVTFPEYTPSSTRQRRYLYARDDRSWV